MNGDIVNNKDQNHLLPKGNKETLYLHRQDQIKLQQFEKKYVQKELDHRFPLIFNATDGTTFAEHRLIAYALNKTGRSGYNNGSEYTLKVLEELKPTKWSQVVQLSIQKSNDSSTTATPAPPSQLEHPKVPTVTPTSNVLQPLGIVSLRIMHDPHIKSNIFNHNPDFQIVPRGLVNSGNICYMNSVLQLLSYCSPFIKVLKLVQLKTVLNLSQPKSRTPLLDLVLLFQSSFQAKQKALIQTLSPPPFAPDAFYRLLSAHPRFSHLKWGQQEDAEEFLGYLLDGLHEEFVESIKVLTSEQVSLLSKSVEPDLKRVILATVDICQRKNGTGIDGEGNGGDDFMEDDEDYVDSNSNGTSNDGWHEVGVYGGGNKRKNKIAMKRTVEIKPSPINLLFGGQFRSVLEVPRQKEGRSITLDPFQHVQLDISDSGVNTLEDLFRLLAVPEFIPYKSSTGVEVKLRKQNFIDKLPPILIIHLKRFSFVKTEDDFFKIEKLRKLIKYPHILQIPLECISPESRKFQKDIITDYKLNGVVYHHGISSEGGHYTCDVMKPQDESWIRIDDGNISNIETLQVLSSGNSDSFDDPRNAYILMYQRVC